MTTTRERLLDAAERVIRTKGLAAASTREIAREAGCADGTLYNHFVDRADLFVAVFLEKLHLTSLHQILFSSKQSRVGKERS
ncbi:TetR/AcrR family transcriptional regulator [Phormidesmis priestleyi]